MIKKKVLKKMLMVFKKIYRYIPFLFLFFFLNHNLYPASVVSDNGVTQYSTGRKVFKDIYGTYWVFYRDITSDRFVYSYSLDGETWSDPLDPFSSYPDADSTGAIWYDYSNNTVYVVTGNRTQTQPVAGSAPSIMQAFVVAGKPQSNHTISWGAVATPKLSRTSSQYLYKGLSVNIAVSPQNTTSRNILIGASLKLAGGTTKILSGYSLGDADPTYKTLGNFLSPAGLVVAVTSTDPGGDKLPLIIPSNDGTRSPQFYIFDKSPTASCGTINSFRRLRTLDSTALASTNINIAAHQATLTGNENYSHSAVVEPTDGALYTIHYVGVGGATAEPVYLQYFRRKLAFSFYLFQGLK